jgi:bacillolysin
MPKETIAQEKLLSGLRKVDPKLEVTWTAQGDAVSHLSGRLSATSDQKPEQIAGNFLRERRELFRIENPDQQLIFREAKTDPHGWHHVAFQQQLGRVPVWNAMILVHIGRDGVVQTVSSKYQPGIDIDLVPKVEPTKAVEVARKHAKLEKKVEPERAPYNVIYVYERKPHLAWVLRLRGWDWSLDGKTRMPARWQYFVDAHDGTVIARFNLAMTDTATTGAGLSVNNPPLLNQVTKTLQVYHDHTQSTYQLHDTTRQTSDGVDILTYDAAGGGYLSPTGNLSQDDNDNWDDTTGENSTDHNQRILCQEAAVDAHDYAAKVYDYYKNTFGRVSIDNNFNGPGTAIDVNSYVHMQDYDENWNPDLPWNNAMWDTSELLYGDGDNVDQTFFSGALDIVAHEYTHGVTEYEITDAQGQPNGLAGSYESGATNESFSDVFGAFVDRDWYHGDQIIVGGLTTAGKVWRDMSNPTRGLAYNANDTPQQFMAKGVPQPDHYDIRYQGDWDYGGVHINCGILNFACYLATHGGVSQHAGRTPVEIQVYRSDRLGIGFEHAEQIYYLALTRHLTGSPGNGDKFDVTFLDVRQALLDACTELISEEKYGIDQCDYNTLRTAFYAVGVHPAGETYGPDPMIIPWGIWTGTGPDYQSPDIWTEDSAGNRVNAKKGIVNLLSAQVHNIGDQPAQGVKVRFSYSPCGMGYPPSDFKFIDEKTLDLAAGETQKAGPVKWDMTDLKEDYGGIWPAPIDSFDHFCVRVELITTSANDVNSCNNVAQNNFFNVGTAQHEEIETTMVIANPFEDRGAEPVFEVHHSLPAKWKVWFDEIWPGHAVGMDRAEKRLVHCHISVQGPLISAPINGAVKARILGPARTEIEGHLEEAVYSPSDRSFRGKLTARALRTIRPSQYVGEIQGRILDENTGDFTAKIKLSAVARLPKTPLRALSGTMRGRLTPDRQVSIGERVQGELVGGVNLNLQVKP